MTSYMYGAQQYMYIVFVLLQLLYTYTCAWLYSVPVEVV